MQLKHNKELIQYAKTLRKEMTPQERKLLYMFLENYPIKILRQKVIGNYIIDFYCAKAKFAIEIDGSQHFSEEGLEYDKRREMMLRKFGIKTMRISNADINKNFYNVCVAVDNEIKMRI